MRSGLIGFDGEKSLDLYSHPLGFSKVYQRDEVKYVMAIEQKVRLAIVIPWFGREIRGGAEMQAYHLASSLAKRAVVDVTVITTCSRSFHHDWTKNFHKPGCRDEDGIRVHRFAVDDRPRTGFGAVVEELLAVPPEKLVPGVSPVSEHAEQIYLDQNVGSPDLLKFLEREQGSYDYFLFLPYLFPITIKGVGIVKEKAILQPCLHDECYAYLPSVARSFRQAGLLFFNSSGEQVDAKRILDLTDDGRSYVVGEGVEVPESIPPGKLPMELEDRNYLLYIGKRCPEKNTTWLVQAFDRFKRSSSDPTKLVFAGVGNLDPHPWSRDVVDVGMVSDELKWRLIANAKAVVNPSLNESFSRVIYEAWSQRRPVLVHGRCRATAEAVKESGGGMIVEDDLGFMAAVHQLESPALQASVGERGYRYARSCFGWHNVAETYEEILRERLGKTGGVSPLEEPANRLGLPQDVRYGSYSRTYLVVADCLPNFSTLLGEVAECFGLEYGEKISFVTSIHGGIINAVGESFSSYHEATEVSDLAGVVLIDSPRDAETWRDWAYGRQIPVLQWVDSQHTVLPNVPHLPKNSSPVSLAVSCRVLLDEKVQQRICQGQGGAAS